LFERLISVVRNISFLYYLFPCQPIKDFGFPQIFADLFADFADILNMDENEISFIIRGCAFKVYNKSAKICGNETNECVITPLS